MKKMNFVAKVLSEGQKTEEVALSWDACVAAGYTGRDQAGVRMHIAELSKLGVPVPGRIPSMYWIDPERVTASPVIDVVGDETSGEVEFFMAMDEAGSRYFTIASDQTDRKLETVSVAKAKQICTKAVAPDFWRVEDVRDHWDEIRIRSEIDPDGKSGFRLYQEATLEAMMEPEDLLSEAREDSPVEGGRVSLFSGTVPIADGKTVYARRYRLVMEDPVLNRKISHVYEVRILPDRN